MSGQNFGEAAGFISNYLKLKTSPVAVKFLKSKADFPEKTRRPSVALGKRVAVCQAVTMARLYGWTVGLTKEDIVCIPAAFAFGYSDAKDTAAALGKLFGIGSYTQTEEIGRAEAQTIHRLARRTNTKRSSSPRWRGRPSHPTRSCFTAIRPRS